ncbi:MAG TPA: universal stress protein [Alphaproteobacteria bacterium]
MGERQKQTQRVFLVVVDESPELKVALRFAARRARATGGRVAMLYVTEPAEAEWLGVGEIMREERRAEAEHRLQELSAMVQELSGDMPILYVREGNVREELLRLIDEEPSISILVLGADTGPGGPGPLVTALTGKFSGKLHVPLTIVPGSLTDDEVDALT